MDKMAELSLYFSQYGYLAIFLLVFLQEIGVPNPITNELVLLYSGYLAYSGTLSLSKITMVTVFADFIGTSILYFVFYAFGKYILTRKPSWLPISVERIESIKQRFSKGSGWDIYVGRLIPFLRGYVSVGAGIMQIKPRLFLTTVITSALTWSGGLVLLGWCVGPYWYQLNKRMNMAENIMLFVFLSVIIIVVGKIIAKRIAVKKRNSAIEGANS